MKWDCCLPMHLLPGNQAQCRFDWVGKFPCAALSEGDTQTTMQTDFGNFSAGAVFVPQGVMLAVRAIYACLLFASGPAIVCWNPRMLNAGRASL